MLSAVQSRPQLYSPSGLNLYAQCPERYFRQRVQRQKVVEPFSPALAKGIAVHQVLEAAAKEYQLQGTVPVNLRERLQDLLPQSKYPGERAWRDEAAGAADLVKYGLGLLDGESRVLCTESFLRYTYKGDTTCPAFALGAKVDLVLACDNGDGSEHLVVIDYKTGKVEIDTLQELALRIVVQHTFGRHFTHIISSTPFLAERTTRSIVLSDVECHRTWRKIKETVAAIESNTKWQPVPSALCQWCPYFGNGCSLDGESASDDLGLWLGGAVGNVVQAQLPI